MAKEYNKNDLQSFPECARDFIKLVIKKMRYRKKVRADVQAELVAHFEDELRSCKTNGERQQKAQRLIENFGDVKLLAVLLRRAKKRCRPPWRTVVARTFQTIGILILCFILYCIYISLGKPTIAVNYVEEATRLTRPAADESLNAAPIYQKAFDVYNEPPLDAIKDKNEITELTEEELASLKQWLSNNTNTIELFKQASEKPYCWWERKAKDSLFSNLFNTLMPELSHTRKLVKTMVWQVKLKTHSGDIEGALDDLLACYRAGTHLKGPRMLIEQLVGIAVQDVAVEETRTILCNQKIDSQLLKSFQAKLEDLIAKDTYVMNYEVEKFFTKDFIQRCYTDNGRGSGHLIPGQLLKSEGVTANPYKKAFLTLAILAMGANRREMSRESEKIYSTAEEWAAKTPWQLHKENADLEMGLTKWSFFKRERYWPVWGLMPAFARANVIAHRIKADTYATLTIVAILRYKQDKSGYPGTLDDLIQAGYLKRLPMDPWSDKPLVYKTTADGFMLYSVGSNFQDDGGQVARDDKGKVKPYADEGDWVFWPVQK